jgi:hypothetical protein
MTFLSRIPRLLRAGGALLALAIGALPSAHAVPSYARQTGMDCAGCHVGAFGPQLTPAGIRFKLGGYTDSNGKDGLVPLSGMLMAGYAHTSADQEPPPDHLKSNDNLTLDQASLFIAGRASDHLGAFVQVTYDGVAHQASLDQVDLRFATPLALDGHEAIFGVSVNNNPTVQDPFNTLSAWSFPFLSPSSGFGTGDAATLIDGGLAGIVLGASAYGVFDKSWYGEVGTYGSMSPSTQDALGLGRDEQRLEGNAYWRLAYMQDMKSTAFHAGLFGWSARLDPDRTVPGLVDSYRDVGVDGSWQYLGTREHIFSVYGSLTHEEVHTGEDGSNGHLVAERLNATYHYQETWGAGAGLFSTHGSDPDATTRGFMLQADWTPWGKEAAAAPASLQWLNLRLGAQYWHYGTFDGTSQGAGDHDTVSLFAWAAF